MGRLSRIETSPQKVVEFLNGIRAGASIEGAAEASGLGASTVHLWMAKGREEIKRRETPGARPRASAQKYVEFLESYKEALGTKETVNVAIIARAARGGVVVSKTVTTKTYTRKDGTVVTETREETVNQPPQWTAAAWLLERTLPGRYARQETLRFQRMNDAQLLDYLLNGGASDDAGATDPSRATDGEGLAAG